MSVPHKEVKVLVVADSVERQNQLADAVIAEYLGRKDPVTGNRYHLDGMICTPRQALSLIVTNVFQLIVLGSEALAATTFLQFRSAGAAANPRIRICMPNSYALATQLEAAGYNVEYRPLDTAPEL